MPLTDLACKKATCPDTKARERYTDSGGLYLEVMPSGAKLWRWKYRFGGKEKRLALGAYPDVPLAQARADRDKARAVLKDGSDPVQLRKDEKVAKRVAIGTTFEAVGRSWFDHWKGPRSGRHAEYVLRRLEMDVFPVLGAKPAAEITAPQLLAMAKKIEARGAVDIAKRALQTCGQVFRYAVAHGIVERNPAADVRPSDALKPRKKENYARLDAKDVPELLRKIDAYQGMALTRLAMSLMALTFVRTSELIGARWEEFDLEAAEWRIPAARMKMRTLHVVPLSTQAIEILKVLHELRGLSGLVFQGERDHEKPMSNNTILVALKRMGYAGKMTGHGFRGIASTILHENEFEHAHIELQLAHQERDEVSAAYNHAKYLPQRRKMMQWYADHLDFLRRGAKVLPFKAA
ncbi:MULTISPECIES: integrase arm-type DNA-binding domain-containing protein [unclassified Rhizobacter]|jgi:integrase|uniref:tyrosine-type recombinase/integrase n=1 Tax=unclassified Rhizobacter TaxID=2640088 RepID=UPI00070168E7|nr:MULTISPECIES: integrase arm-type DNA-binding domain-containing protein [unclassified Rhizobacter]KQU80382.1 integrase [Rhizobacter sp. Root29]KQW13880.1 integrase [Rhizobacter sp. Root1238]